MEMQCVQILQQHLSTSLWSKSGVGSEDLTILPKELGSRVAKQKKHTDVFWENAFTYFFMNVLFLYVCQQLIYCIKGIRLKQLLFST